MTKPMYRDRIGADGRPDLSPKAIAERRELHRAALADSALEGCVPDAEALQIAERWIKGEITTDEELALIKERIRTRHLKARELEKHGR